MSDSALLKPEAPYTLQRETSWRTPPMFSVNHSSQTDKIAARNGDLENAIPDSIDQRSRKPLRSGHVPTARNRRPERRSLLASVHRERRTPPARQHLTSNRIETCHTNPDLRAPTCIRLSSNPKASEPDPADTSRSPTGNPRYRNRRCNPTNIRSAQT